MREILHNILLFLALTKPRGMLCPNGTVKPFLVSLVEPVAYLNLSYGPILAIHSTLLKLQNQFAFRFFRESWSNLEQRVVFHARAPQHCPRAPVVSSRNASAVRRMRLPQKPPAKWKCPVRPRCVFLARVPNSN